jgi:hypothetical protein
MRPIERPHAARRIAAALATAGTTAVLALAPVSSPSASAATTCNPTTATGWKAAITNAQKSLDVAITSLHARHYGTAITKLRAMKRQVRIAHTGATGLIGKPPSDPESDEPPGPNAVQRVAGLEHQVTLKLLPQLDRLSGPAVTPLGAALNVTDRCRDVMIGKVVALKPGKLDDYTDGLSDTLPSYKKELTAFSTALSTYALTTRARSAVDRAQTVVAHTDAVMQKHFGGGERPAP